MAEQKLAIVGDIGGTNARFALVEPESTKLLNIEVLPCRDYGNLDDAFFDYMARQGLSGIKQASLAFACPVHMDIVKMTNNHWSFSKQSMQEKLHLDQFKCVNDFTAMALGVPHISTDQLVKVGGGTGNESKPRLVLGPGTGLGVSGLVKTSAAWIPLSTEGGHVDFAPTNELEMALLANLFKKFHRVSVERLLCGEGIVNIYAALAEINGRPVEYVEPAKITQAALDSKDELAIETLNLFCRVFGQVAGNAVLTLGALGGVYICGGIIPRFIDFFKNSDFRKQFDDKGRMTGYVEEVPAYIVTEKYTGLLGAAEALMNSEVV